MMKAFVLEPSPFETKNTALDTPAKQQKSHLTILDTLRGIAALSVCVFHFTTGALTTFRHPIATFIGHRGYLGVDMFFVISGFIIPFALARSNYSFKKFGQFMVRRFVRIAPPAYVAMLIFIGTGYLLYYINMTNSPQSDSLTWPRLMHNILFTIPFTSYKWINGIFWTLSIEFEFYLVLGLVFSLIRNHRIGILIVGLLLSASYYIPGMPEPTLFHHNVLFTIGMSTWLFFDKLISRTYFFFLLGVFSVIGVFQVTPAPVIIAVVTSLCILYLRFKHPLATFLGNISYSLYLMHIIIGYTVELFLIKIIPIVNIATVFVSLLLCIGVTLGISYLFYQYIETPFMKMSSQLFRAKRLN